MKKTLITYLFVFYSFTAFSQTTTNEPSLTPVKDIPIKDTVIKSGSPKSPAYSNQKIPLESSNAPIPTANSYDPTQTSSTRLKNELKLDKQLSIYADTVDLIECNEQVIIYGVVNSQKAKADIEAKVKNMHLFGEIQNKIIVR